MFVRRLSTALCAIVFFSGSVLGTVSRPLPDANKVDESKMHMAPAAVTFIPTFDAPTCNGDSDGFIYLNNVSGVAPFTYELKQGGVILNSNTFAVFPYKVPFPVPEGSYDIVITDFNGDNGSNSISVDDFDVLSVDLESSINYPECVGDKADFNFIALGGDDSNYTYNLYKGTSTEDSNNNGEFYNLGEGIYSLMVLDANGCSQNYNGTIKIDEPEAIDFNLLIVDEINCDNGFATVDLNNLPSEDFDVQFVNDDTGELITAHDADYVYSSVGAGSYTITMSSVACPANSKPQRISITSFNDVQINATPSSPHALSCGGVNDVVTVELDITGGNGSRTLDRVKVILDNNNAISSDDPETTIDYGSIATFPNIGAGNYTIRWNDVENPSCSGSQNYIINSPSSPVAYSGTVVGFPIKCNGDANGTVQIPVSGGSPPYSYFIDGVDKGDDVNAINLAAGLGYEVYVRDFNGCETEKVLIDINSVDPLNASHLVASDNQVTCFGGSDGEISIDITGGNGGYKYNLSGTEVRNDRNANSSLIVPSLVAGTYNIEIVDSEGCLSNVLSGIEITEPDEITIDVFDFSEDVVCFGKTTNLTVAAIGGSVASKTYELYKGGASGTLIGSRTGTGEVTFNDLTSSTYYLKIVDNPNCAFKDSTFVIQATQQLVVNNTTDSIMVDCFGDHGQLNLSVQGSAPFTYELDGVAMGNFDSGNSTLVSPLDATTVGQTHQIQVYDKDGCSTDFSLTVYTPTAITNSSPIVTDVTCKDEEDGTVSINIEGGTAGYEVSLGSNVLPSSGGNVLFQNVDADSYTLQIVDAKGCSLATPLTGIVVNEPTDDFVINDPVFNKEIKCDGDIAEVEITASGGWNVDRSITVVGNGINQTLTTGFKFELPEGNYTITASNSDGCSDTRPFVVTAPDALILSITDKSDVSCAGAKDASFKINVTGGTGTYKYGLENSGSANVDFAGNSVTLSSTIESKTYQVVVSDQNGCESNVEEVVINEPTEVDFTVVDVDSVECNGEANGRILLSSTGGSGVYQYSYTLAGSSVPFQTNRTFDGLSAGSYTLNVKDNAGCNALSNGLVVEILQPNNPVTIFDVNIIREITCADSSNAIVDISATGGEPFGNLQYSVTGVAWQSNHQITGLGEGVYTAFVKDSRGKCQTSWSAPIELSEPAPIVIVDPSPEDVSCNNLQDGSVNIVVTGGDGNYTYYLYDDALIADQKIAQFTGLGGFTATPKVPSSVNYRIEVRDGYSCFGQNTFTVENPAKLELEYVDKRDVLCSDETNGWIKVRATGGLGDYTFKRNFSDASSISDDLVESEGANVYSLMNFGGGFYRPSVTEGTCGDTLLTQVEIVNPEKVVITSVDPGVKLCFGDMDDETIIHAEGGVGDFKYSLSDGENLSSRGDSIFIGESIGTKYPYVVDENGCDDTADMYEFTQPDKFEVYSLFTGFKCWDDESANLDLRLRGGTGDYTVSLDPNFTSDLYPINRSNDGDTTYYNALNDGGLYLDDGIRYEFYLKDENNCHVQNITSVRKITDIFADTTFTRPQKLVLDNVTPKSVNCKDENTGIIEFNASGGTITSTNGYQLRVVHEERGYEKTNDLDVDFVDELFSGPHQCYLTDANGCIGETSLSPLYPYEKTIVPYANESIGLAISNIVSPTCDITYDGEIEINVNDYREDGVTIYVDYLDEDVDEYWKFDENDTIAANRDYYRISEKGDTLYYRTAQIIADNANVGSYAIFAVDNYTGCETRLDTVLTPEQDVCPDINNYSLFSPHNGDDLYDEWTIFGSQFQKYSLKIYTQFGELVYEDDGLSDGGGVRWSGVDDKDRPVSVGTYIYLLRQHEGTPRDTTIHGNVTILRGNGR